MENIRFNIDSIKKTKNDISINYYDLLALFKEYLKMIDDTKSVCDTETSKYFRMAVSEYLIQEIKRFNNEFKDLFTIMDDTCHHYNDELNKIDLQIKGVDEQ